MDQWDDATVVEFKDDAAAGVAGDAVVEEGLLVSEGDSWFDYAPGTDVIDCLKAFHGHRIENFAKAGDTLENMVYGTGITRKHERTTPTIERVLRKVGQVRPRALLFSGGGNDLVGDGFESLLNHAGSGLPALRRSFVDLVIGQAFRTYYRDLVAKVRAVSPTTTVVTHGYGHTLPTGRGVDIWFRTWTGPWLRPALARKAILDPAEQARIVAEVIDAFNDMLSALATATPGLVHIDLRDEIDPASDWVNELHLKNSAYKVVAEMFDDAIRSL